MTKYWYIKATRLICLYQLAKMHVRCNGKKNDVYLNLVKIVCASTPPHVAQQRKC